MVVQEWPEYCLAIFGRVNNDVVPPTLVTKVLSGIYTDVYLNDGANVATPISWTVHKPNATNQGGHYFAYAKEGNRMIMFNDAMVTSVPQDSVDGGQLRSILYQLRTTQHLNPSQLASSLLCV